MGGNINGDNLSRGQLTIVSKIINVYPTEKNLLKKSVGGDR